MTQDAQEFAQSVLDGVREAQYPWVTPLYLQRALAKAVNIRWCWGVVQDSTHGPVRRRLLCIEGPRSGVLYARQKPFARRPESEPMCRRGRWEVTANATEVTFEEAEVILHEEVSL